MYKEKILSNASLEISGIAKINENDFNIENDGTIISKRSFLQTTGPDISIEQIIEKYYNGIYSLNDIKSIQAIGDIRNSKDYNKKNFRINAISIKQVIIDFDHDILTTPINNINKALITIQTLGSYGSYSMGSYIQTSTTLRTTLNNTIYNDCSFKEQIKQITHNHQNYSQGTQTCNDFLFVPSRKEIFNQESGSTNDTQYEYFTFSIYRLKKDNLQDEGNSYTMQQQRSGYESSSAYFRVVNSIGNDSYITFSSKAGLIITCCL